MSLCKICQGININSIVVYIDLQDDSRSNYCYSHHQSYYALSQSARSCPLCDLILHGLELANTGRTIPEEYTKHTENRIWLLAGTDAFFDTETPKALSHLRVNVGKGGTFKAADLSVTALPNDPLAINGDVVGRMVDAEKSPAELFQTIKNWYNTCKESHELCRRPDGILHPLPTRVIDVGYNSSSLLSLLPSNGQKGHYAALSYCWGASQTFTTTAETFASRCSGFSLADLPQTIRDAVITTREMGLRYLWVDAICIIQGDASDWASESTKMAQVYGNAEITICATSSPDTISGLFRPRWSANKNAIAVQSRCSAGGQTGTMVLSTRLGSVDDVMDDAVLNTRAWCLQERILSHRIIHFAQDQLYWECQQHLQAEEGLNIPSPNSLKKSLRTRDPEPWSTMLRHWHATLVDYTRRNLSHLSDKLPAVSGLARMVYEQSQVDYVAGLWREDLPFALLWYADPMRDTDPAPRPATQWRAPSWSWAAIDGPVNSQGYRLNVAIMRVVLDQAHVVSCSVSTKYSDPFGELLAGCMKLKTRMGRGRRSECQKEYDYGGWKGDLSREYPLLSEDGAVIGAALFDEPHDEPPMEFECLLIVTGIITTGKLNTDKLRTYMLIVVAHEPGYFTRLGAASITGSYFEGHEVVEVMLR